MREARKLMSLVIVAAMVLMGFSALLPMAGADVISEQDDRGVEITDTNLDNGPVYPGEQDYSFWVEVWNYNMGGSPDVPEDTSDTIFECQMTISQIIRNEDGQTVTTPLSDFSDNTDFASTINNNGNNYFWFSFDVKGDAEPGTYNLTVSFSYRNNNASGSEFTMTGWIHFDIEARGTVYDLPYNDVLTPGDQNKDVRVQVNLHEQVTDVYLRITRPDTDFTWFGTSSATASAYDDNMNGWWYPNYIISVSPDKDAETYTGTYVLEYTINEGTDDEVRCTETGDIDFQVGHLAMLSMTSTTTTIAQGTSTTSMSLTFTNSGTVDLFSVMVWIDVSNDEFSFMPRDHWEDNDPIGSSKVDLGNMATTGTTQTKTITMDIGIDLYIPEGDHKMMFAFDGYYYEPDSQTYKTLNTWWTQANLNDPADFKVTMDGTTFTIDPDESTVKGPYIMITVTDTAMDLTITSLGIADSWGNMADLSLGGRLVDNALTLSVQNFGNIDFVNMVVKLETNTATSPFLNVIDPTAPFSEEAIIGTLNGVDMYGNMGEARPILRVDLKPGISSGVHSVPLTITAVNNDMGEAVETVLNARITITGIGPKLEITDVTPGEIKNGADFTLTLVITNNGDDTARNVVLTMPGEEGVALLEEPNEINGDITAPTADALPMYLVDIAPGESLTVEIPMKANKDMSSGHVYLMTFRTTYTDSFDNPANVDHGVSLKSTGFGGTTLGLVYYSLIILFLVAAIFLLAWTVIQVKKYKKANPKDGIETQTEYTPQNSFPEEPTDQTPPPPPVK